MSREAWGDEGNVCNDWEETAIHQELDDVIARFEKWNRVHDGEMPNPEFVDGVCRIRDELDALREAISGKIDA